MEKILNATQIKKYFPKLSSKIVLVGGCFDILHVGHTLFLEKARKKGDFLVVLLESDNDTMKKKGEGRPFNSQKDRAQVLSALSSVDLVVLLPRMKDSDYDEIVEIINPSIIAITANDPTLNYKKRSGRKVRARVLTVVSRLSSHSTSNLTKFLQK